jgi:CRP-like cAMP-binding protein
MVQNIVVQTNRELLEPMFRSLKSDNMIHELCLALEGQIYLPQDFIISKGEVGDEMYFIVEGSVHVIAGDKMTIVKTLNKGQYFGEIAIFFSTKRVAYVQAATFCLVNRLKKKDLDKITDSFPQIAEDLARQG